MSSRLLRVGVSLLRRQLLLRDWPFWACFDSLSLALHVSAASVESRARDET
jgi:hypothetical protein